MSDERVFLSKFESIVLPSLWSMSQCRATPQIALRLTLFLKFKKRIRRIPSSHPIPLPSSEDTHKISAMNKQIRMPRSYPILLPSFTTTRNRKKNEAAQHNNTTPIRRGCMMLSPNSEGVGGGDQK